MDTCHSKSDVGGGERCTSAGQKEEDGGEVPVQEILKEEEGERQQAICVIKKEEGASPHDDSEEYVEREEEDELDEDDDDYAYDDEEDRRKEEEELLEDDRTDESLTKFSADLHRFKTDATRLKQLRDDMAGKLLIAKNELFRNEYGKGRKPTDYQYLKDQVDKYEYRKSRAQKALDKLSGASTQ